MANFTRIENSDSIFDFFFSTSRVLREESRFLIGEFLSMTKDFASLLMLTDTTEAGNYSVVKDIQAGFAFAGLRCSVKFIASCMAHII